MLLTVDSMSMPIRLTDFKTSALGFLTCGVAHLLYSEYMRHLAKIIKELEFDVACFICSLEEFNVLPF